MKTSNDNPTIVGEAPANGHMTIQTGELHGKWSNRRLPKIGDKVRVTFNGLGTGEILGFFQADGDWIGVTVKPDKRPDWHIRQNGSRHPNYTVFGAEIVFLNP